MTTSTEVTTELYKIGRQLNEWGNAKGSAAVFQALQTVQQEMTDKTNAEGEALAAYFDRRAEAEELRVKAALIGYRLEECGAAMRDDDYAEAVAEMKRLNVEADAMYSLLSVAVETNGEELADLFAEGERLDAAVAL